jgi:hypothetical protein
MTESQLLLFPQFRSLPVYDESDERSNTIAAAPGAGLYVCVRECSTLREVEECLRNPRLVPLGALRAGADGNRVVVAYFGEKK